MCCLHRPHTGARRPQSSCEQKGVSWRVVCVQPSLPPHAGTLQVSAGPKGQGCSGQGVSLRLRVRVEAQPADFLSARTPPPHPQQPEEPQCERGLDFSPVRISFQGLWDEGAAGISSELRNSAKPTHLPRRCHFSAQGPWVGWATWEVGQTQAPQGPASCPSKTELGTGCPQEATPKRNSGQEIPYTQRAGSEAQPAPPTSRDINFLTWKVMRKERGPGGACSGLL